MGQLQLEICKALSKIYDMRRYQRVGKNELFAVIRGRLSGTMVARQRQIQHGLPVGKKRHRISLATF